MIWGLIAVLFGIAKHFKDEREHLQQKRALRWAIMGRQDTYQRLHDEIMDLYKQRERDMRDVLQSHTYGDITEDDVKHQHALIRAAYDEKIAPLKAQLSALGDRS